MNVHSSVLIRNLILLISALLILVIYYLIYIGNRFVEDNKRIKSIKKVLPILFVIIFIYSFYLLSKNMGFIRYP